MLEKQLDNLNLCLNDAEVIIEAVSNEDSKFKSELETKQQEVIMQLTDDVAFLKDQLEEAQIGYQSDLKELQKVYDSKIGNAQNLLFKDFGKITSEYNA